MADDVATQNEGATENQNPETESSNEPMDFMGTSNRNPRRDLYKRMGEKRASEVTGDLDDFRPGSTETDETTEPDADYDLADDTAESQPQRVPGRIQASPGSQGWGSDCMIVAICAVLSDFM